MRFVRRPMFVISIGFTVTSAVMFAAAKLAAAHLSVLSVSLDRDGATAAVVLAGMCWLELRRDVLRERRDGERLRRMKAEYDRREEALILALNSLADAPTGPLRQLRAL